MAHAKRPPLMQDELDAFPVVIATTDAARIFGVPPQTLCYLVRKGRSPVTPVRIGKKYMFSTQKCRDFMGI